MNRIASAPQLARLRSGHWFQGLPAALQAQLEAATIARHLEAGSRLFARGDAPDGLYCVVEGGVRITSLAADGREALLAIVEAPNWFGEIALVDGQPRTHDAWAEGDTTVLHVTQARLEALLQARPAYWRDFARLLSQKLRLAFVALEEGALLDASGRVARRLAAIAEGYGESPGRSRRTIKLSQEQLGAMLALSRQTVNQVLKQLEARGAVRLVRGGVEIVDLEQLREGPMGSPAR